MEGRKLKNPKVSQWTVLNRVHATALAKKYVSGQLMPLKWFQNEQLLIEKDALNGATDEPGAYAAVTADHNPAL